MIEKPADTALPIYDLLGRRWSSHAIDPERAMERRDLAALLEAVLWAPSGCTRV